jgi:hypothetical protein
MRFSLLVALSLVADIALAQTEKPPAREERAAPAQEERTAPAPRLNLKLDNAGNYAREVPREDAGSAQLPALGGDARPMPAKPLSDPLDGPFPKDSERGER